LDSNIYHVLQTGLMQDLLALNSRRGAIEYQHTGFFGQVSYSESFSVENHPTGKVRKGVDSAFCGAGYVDVIAEGFFLLEINKVSSS